MHEEGQLVFLGRHELGVAGEKVTISRGGGRYHQGLYGTVL